MVTKRPSLCGQDRSCVRPFSKNNFGACSTSRYLARLQWSDGVPHRAAAERERQAFLRRTALVSRAVHSGAALRVGGAGCGNCLFRGSLCILDPPFWSALL